MSAESRESRKVTIIDTSVLIHDPDSLFSFGKNIVVLPFSVIEEIDRHKMRNDNNTMAARQVGRSIRNLGGQTLLACGVPLENGGILITDSDPYVPKRLGYALKIDSADNFIIGVALKWQHQNELAKSSHSGRRTKERNGERKLYKNTINLCERYDITNIRIITKDNILYLKAGACGVDAEDYEKGRIISKISDLYTGLEEISVNEEASAAICGLFYSNKEHRDRIPMEEVQEIIDLPQFIPNMGCIFRNGSVDKTALAIYQEEEGQPYFKVVPKHFNKQQGIQPRNDQQRLAYKLLTDPAVRIITLAGLPGGGKTLMALAAGLEQITGNKPLYDQMLIYRANSEIGEKVGYLKGSLAEKTDPWARPVMDSLELIAEGGEREIWETKPKKGDFYDIPALIKNGKIQISLINFLRGRSLHHKFVVIDETQNFKPGDIKKVLGRIGKGSKFILTGDVDQVDNPFLDPLSNGLTHVIEGLKGQPNIGHIAFPKSERDELVELITRLL